ncbi:MAG TPA: hypothetical protein DD434_14340 [Bacteroidales bacterium]|mgnify:CR=1 FL=1|nr:hypothetical protein [Bacteroidales bacterium]
MRINKLIIILFCVLFLYSCAKKENINFNNSYQIYKVNDSTIFYLYLNDKWGESNSLGLIDNNSHYSIDNIDIDPIPIIKDVKNDTIILDYYLAPYKLEQIIDTTIFKQPDNERIRKIGKYKIIYHEYSYFRGEGLKSDTIIDSIFFDNKTFNVCFYKDNRKIKELNQRNLMFEKDKNKFCYFIIDSIHHDLNWHYLSPQNEKITQKYFESVY